MTNQDNTPKGATELRQKAEALARQRAARTPEDSKALFPEEIRDTLHELRVHQIELEMQNEELRRAQAEIEAGRARYFDLYDLAPVGYCTLSEKGLILEANLTAATLLGTNRGELIKQPIFGFILKEDQDIYYLRRKQLFETVEPQECELRMVKPDGAFIWVHLTATAAQAEYGTPVCRVVLSDITKRKKTEEQIKASIEEKEVLLRELYHRTKNNMQVILSMINLQTQNIEDEDILQMFKETKDRISTMSLVHEKLYQTKNLSRIDLKDYFTDLINLLRISYQNMSEGIRIKTDMSSTRVTIDSAIPCGLILNELISNVFKHAFPENRRGEVQINLKTFEDKSIEFVVGDNGIGLPDLLDIRNVDTMGLKSIVALAEHQLSGSAKVVVDNGTKFYVTFKELSGKERV